MTMPLYDYDDEDLQSVINYTYRLLNKKFKTIIDAYQKSTYKSYRDYQTKTISNTCDKEINMKSKGQYGNYIERYFYGY